MSAYDEAERIVRERDRDRFVADLFVPEVARRHLHALHAFNSEIARIRFVVSEPALGEIRLQWWRDAIAHREGGGNPLAEALLSTISALKLSVDAFDAMLTARIFDLYNDPTPTMGDFEGYAGETDSTLFQFGVLALSGGTDPGSADASGHAGVAFALRDALVRFVSDVRRRQLFLPRDRFEAAGVDIDALFATTSAPGVKAALAGLCDTARGHLQLAKTAISALPPALRVAYLPLALVEPDLSRLDFSRPFDTPPMIPQWRRQLRMWRAARRGLG